MDIHTILQSTMKCLAKKAPALKKRIKNRSSFGISKDVVEHREQNSNSSVPAGAEDLSVHIEQVER